MILSNLNGTQMSEERNAKVVKVLLKRQNDITVVLDNVDDPHNIAAVLRTCDAIGIMEIFVLNTHQKTHRKFDPKTSSSANKWMLVHQYTDAKSCFEHVRKHYPKIYSTHLGESAKDLYELNLSEPCALVFGNESTGISPEVLAFCDANFIIPQVGMIQSLNISVACAICLYEAFRQKNLAHHYDNPKLNADQNQQLLDFWQIQQLSSKA